MKSNLNQFDEKTLEELFSYELLFCFFLKINQIEKRKKIETQCLFHSILFLNFTNTKLA